MLEVYIGPNGFGKTTKLNNIKTSLINDGIDTREILFLESEILLLDEVKDTKDSTKTMEYILTDLLSTPEIDNAKRELEILVDRVINSNVQNLNNIMESLLRINNQSRTVNFLNITPVKEYKKMVSIDSTDVKKRMGSGQRMQLILELVKSSTKNYIFLDEPEKYSHPSMLNKTAKLIEEIAQNKNVYIATHSPKLLSMINVELSNIFIINDNTHTPKDIDFQGVLQQLSTVNINNFNNKSKTYFDFQGLKKNIRELHYREFVESLFAKKVYICEGINDELFIKKLLMHKGLYNDDYVIFHSYGKHHMMVFAEIYKSLSIDFQIFFDKDDEQQGTDHLIANEQLINYNHYMFDKTIEKELGFRGGKGNTVQFISFLETIDYDLKEYLVNN